jgi:hypothetical protein
MVRNDIDSDNTESIIDNSQTLRVLKQSNLHEILSSISQNESQSVD